MEASSSSVYQGQCSGADKCLFVRKVDRVCSCALGECEAGGSNALDGGLVGWVGKGLLVVN